MNMRRFVDEHYLHFNAGTVREACQSLRTLVEGGGKIFLTLAGAMSTAEIGRTLAELIRDGCIAGISCTGANLEEDVFNLVAHDHYVRIDRHEDLSPQDEMDLLKQGLNRVTDTCIPEAEAIRAIEGHLLEAWKNATADDTSALPHQYLYELLRSGALEAAYQAKPEHSWLLAAAQADLPLFVPGWEDSTLGNIFAARATQGIVDPNIVQGGVHYMTSLIEFYRATTNPLAILQVGGGIAGDFPLCVVPLLHQDLGETDVPLWAWFAQITDATASYGGFSGAPPNEKITWGKLGPSTPRYNIQSDASIVLPLMFAYLLNW